MWHSTTPAWLPASGESTKASSVSDSDPDEIKRRMSINLSVVPLEWHDSKINFLDTPGYADFVGEVMSALRVADAAVVVVSADKGAEIGTEMVWKYANADQLPRLVFVNKLDRDNTSYEQALESLRSHFGSGIVSTFDSHRRAVRPFGSSRPGFAQGLQLLCR